MGVLLGSLQGRVVFGKFLTFCNGSADGEPANGQTGKQTSQPNYLASTGRKRVENSLVNMLRGSPQ